MSIDISNPTQKEKMNMTEKTTFTKKLAKVGNQKPENANDISQADVLDHSSGNLHHGISETP
jgi:hypothetical protein